MSGVGVSISFGSTVGMAKAVGDALESLRVAMASRDWDATDAAAEALAVRIEALVIEGLRVEP